MAWGRRCWRWVVLPVILGGAVAWEVSGEDAPPLWLSSASGASEILIFSKIHRDRDGRGYVVVEEAQRAGSRQTVRAAAGELLRSNYDLIVPLRFEYNLGVHVFINGRGEPLVAVDTTVTPPALAVSRPFREGERIYLGTTRDMRETISMAYYRHMAEALERGVPELAVIARRSMGLPAGSRLGDGFAGGEEETR